MTYRLDAETLADIRSALGQLGEAGPYSGRTMYGEECLAITTDDVARAFAWLGMGGGHHFTAASGRKFRELLDLMMESDIRYDASGKYNTVVYFPWIIIDGEME